MNLLILVFSSTGNNRLLAQHVADRLGADLEEVRDTRWFRKFRLPGDLKHDRRPPIAPIAADVASYDHVICMAPIWDLNIAHPMKTALERIGPAAKRLSFVSFCGYHRDGQPEGLGKQLRMLTGRDPDHVKELWVGDLVPPEKREKVRVVTLYRVKPDELEHFADALDEIEGWFLP